MDGRKDRKEGRREGGMNEMNGLSEILLIVDGAQFLFSFFFFLFSFGFLQLPVEYATMQKKEKKKKIPLVVNPNPNPRKRLLWVQTPSERCSSL